MPFLGSVMIIMTNRGEIWMSVELVVRWLGIETQTVNQGGCRLVLGEV